MVVNQPLPFLGIRRSHLDGKFAGLAFEAVMEGGSYERARRILTQNGYVNRFTGKPYTYMGVYLAANRYLCENHAKLKDRLIKKWYEQENIYVTDEEWEEMIVRKAKMTLGNSSPKRFLDWLADNPWAEKYDYIYAESFGITPKNRK